MERIAIPVCPDPIRGTIRPPGSKSITNRALVVAALAEGDSLLRGALDSEDTRVMLDAWDKLGIKVRRRPEAAEIEIVGCGGHIPRGEAELFLANSGTSMRFLAAAVALGHGRYRLDGIPRMRERPIADLADALNALGAEVECESPGGCPPLSIRAAGLAGGEVTMRGDVSSQFLSGLLMAAPPAAGDVRIRIEGTLVSQPYVRMTLEVMRAFGAAVETDDLRQFRIPGGQQYRGRTYSIEPDASAASYFWAAAAISGGKVTVEGLSRDSLQGDVAFCDCLQRMGCRVTHAADSITVAGGPLRGISVDMNAISDTVQTLAAVALFAEGPTEIGGVGHIRHKETDRIGDLATELCRLGAEVEQRPDGLTIRPGPLRAAKIATYNDHRMAMSLALVGLKVPGIEILDPACTHKTYPNYFQDLFRLCGLEAGVDPDSPAA